MSTAATSSLITAEAFAEMRDIAEPCELVRGEIVVSPPPSFDHGEVCAMIAQLIGPSVRKAGLGRVLTNDSGVLTERDPDSVRGADVSFYSYKSVPKGKKPYPYADVPPELVFEVRSPSQAWSMIHSKVAEYLTVGVKCVCVADFLSKKVVVHHAEQPSETLVDNDVFQLPEILGDFRVKISEFFA